MADYFRSIAHLLAQQRQLLSDSFDQFDPAPLQQLAESIAHCTGVVVLTGVGKSGFIAQKVAMTLVSCGIKAIFLSPTDALHGDIGILGASDWMVAMSRTGQSDELLQLAPFVKARGVKLAAIVGNTQSRLAKWADLVVLTPFEKEVGVVPMVPTTSTALQLIYADLLAVAAAAIKGFSLEEFARNHPAGQIGKRLGLKVGDLMLTGSQLPLAYPTQTIGEVLVELSNKRSGCLVVVDTQQRLLGVFTDGDLRRGLQKYGKDALDRRLDEAMTHHPKSISASELAYDALVAMESNPQRPITTLPVVDQEQVIGLIRLHDMLQAGL